MTNLTLYRTNYSRMKPHFPVRALITHNSHVWTDENSHVKVESISFLLLNVYCGIIDAYLIETFILENRLTGNYYLDFIRFEL